MEIVIIAVSVVLVLIVGLVLLLALRDRKSRSTSTDDAPQDARHADAMARAYGAGVARDAGKGAF